MSDYTITKSDEAPDVLGDYPGEMRMFAGPIGAEQVAFTYRVMPPSTGGKGSYGHSHKNQEEIYFVISGTLQFKLGDDVIDVGPKTAVRVAPSTVRSVWNEGPADAELIICSTIVDDPQGETELHEDFWPE
jgi:mannose-6-phosphate isomerase-like protein (cupin superfamily)